MICYSKGEIWTCWQKAFAKLCRSHFEWKISVYWKAMHLRTALWPVCMSRVNHVKWLQPTHLNIVRQFQFVQVVLSGDKFMKTVDHRRIDLKCFNFTQRLSLLSFDFAPFLSIKYLNYPGCVVWRSCETFTCTSTYNRQLQLRAVGCGLDLTVDE